MKLRALGLMTTFVGAAAVIGLSGGTAAAAPLPVDHAVPPNGIPAPGYSRSHLITPPGSPVQVPRPTVTTDGNHTTYQAYPFFSEWFHNAFPVPPKAALDAAGGIQATVVDPSTKRVVTVDVAGHCLFVGHDLPADPATSPTVKKSVLPQIRIDTPAFKVSIDPTGFLGR